MTTKLECRRVTKRFERVTAIRDLDLSIEAGSIHAIVGPNGAGKSTLLRLMGGLMQPSSGTITLEEDAMKWIPRPGLGIHWVSPEMKIYPAFRVTQVLRYARLLHPGWDAAREQTLIATLDLPQNTRVGHLSLGMRLKLQLTIAFAARANLLLLDEATHGLDPVGRGQVLDLVLRESAERGMTVVLATHQLSDVERAADMISVLAQGGCVGTWPIDELRERVYEVSAFWPREGKHRASSCPGAIMTRPIGERVLSIVYGHQTEIDTWFRTQGATQIDVHHAQLSVWLESLLTKEGAALEQIVLS
ncbi:MAG: ABC transporter ATP-binding protein [Firmicutes bacterium]|nr:ABC transporter ATP-binding protein [Bacillota bacterium]